MIQRQHVPGDQVDDIVQDTLLSIYLVRHTYDPSRPLSPWLAAIAQRRALDSRRRRARIETLEVAAPELLVTFPDPSANNQVEINDEHGWLRRAVRTLTPKQRVAIELAKLHGLSVADSASMSGLPVAGKRLQQGQCSPRAASTTDALPRRLTGCDRPNRLTIVCARNSLGDARPGTVAFHLRLGRPADHPAPWHRRYPSGAQQRSNPQRYRCSDRTFD